MAQPATTQAKNRRSPNRRLTPLPENTSPGEQADTATRPLISSRTAGDRRTQMQLSPVRRVRPEDIPRSTAELNKVELRCANCARRVPAGTVLMTGSIGHAVRSGTFECAPCRRNDNVCANCLVTMHAGQRTTNKLGQSVHTGGCPARPRPRR